MRLLDLFCGAGGAAMGYHRAGFDEIVGIDIDPQPHYPFTFIQADALAPPVRLEDFDLIHASPPCQAFSSLRHMWNAKDHADLIPATRELLLGLSHVIENVPGSSLRFATLRLCGSQFGLGTGDAELRRHRYFELSFPMLAPPCLHGQARVIGVYGGHGRDRRRRISSQDFSTDERREAMGINWMTGAELSQAIPPAYTEFVGRQFLDQLSRITDALLTTSHAGSETTSPTDRSP